MIQLIAALALTATTPSSSERAANVNSALTFSWCTLTPLTVDLDFWNDRAGIVTKSGWSYRQTQAHSLALRVDGTTIYAIPALGPNALPCTSITVDQVAKTGQIIHEVPGLARITTNLSGLESQVGIDLCCSLKQDMEVENLSTTPHFFEVRWFHDTAFFDLLPDMCLADPLNPDVDGGDVCLAGTTPPNCRTVEFDALAEGAIGCANPITFYSADTGLPQPSYILDDTINTPSVAEVIFWDARGQQPDSLWSGFVNGEPFAGCLGDTSMLLAWRLPPNSGTLAPGAKGQLTFSMGQACAPACPCSSGIPGDILNTVRMVKDSAVRTRITAYWAAPPRGTTYNIKRRDIRDFLSFPGPDDERPGITGTTWTIVNTPLGLGCRYYRVQAVSCMNEEGPL